LNVPTDPEDFVDWVSLGELSNHDVIELANAHRHDYSSCALCSHLENELQGNVVELLFEHYKERLSQDAFDALFQAMPVTMSYENGGYLEGVMVEFALHPLSSSEELDAACRDYAIRERFNIEAGGMETEDEFMATLSRVAGHPKATEEIIRNWLSEVHDLRHYGSPVLCEICKQHLLAVRGKTPDSDSPLEDLSPNASRVTLPENLEDISWGDYSDGWPHSFVTELRSRIGEVTNELISDAIDEESVSLESGAELALELADSIKSTVKKLEFLQYTLASIVDSHDDWDYIPSAMLEVMWKILEIVDLHTKMETEDTALQKAAGDWLADQNMTNFPVALCATFALAPGMQTVADSAIESFLECWNWSGKEFTLKENNNWDVFEWNLEEFAPLAAILSLTPTSNPSAVEKLFRITLEGAYPSFSLAFWEYVTGYLAEDRESWLWSPSEAWNRGFFSNLPAPSKLPSIRPESSYRALEFFFTNIDNHNLTDVHGEQTLAIRVVAMFASHPITPEAFREKAMAFPGVQEELGFSLDSLNHGVSNTGLPEADPFGPEFEMAVECFSTGNEKKALKMLMRLAKKGHSASIWELFNRAISESDLKGAKKLFDLERSTQMRVMLHAILEEAQHGIDLDLYEQAYEVGFAGAAYHLSRHFATAGEKELSVLWASRAEAMGEIDDETMSQLWDLVHGV
jgi:hypothetical protein